MRSEGWSPWALGEGTGLSHLGRAASGSGGGGGSWGHWDEEECVSLCQAHPLGLLLVVGLPLVTTLFSASNESPRIRGGARVPGPDHRPHLQVGLCFHSLSVLVPRTASPLLSKAA